MSPISIGVLAVSMSVDAFIASLGKGATARRPGFGRAIKTGMIFGAVEAITPLIGWGLGMAASQYVQAVDHWIAFALLGAVGVHMALQALSRKPDDAPAPASVWAVVVTAIGTSIDAMAVGVSLAFLDVNIFVIALAIGLATMVMSSTGMLAGRYLGHRFGRIIEAFGGLALITLGTLILIEHLTA
ncbi:manganese efflux pump MntP family protein [Paracoccus laeviglucosivorans]|uniref:Putative manganese efflux pump MntP n=1 Tax=Paracoccus laeviglucosivorans TaxID=1197861 RepID=A0A521DVG6_9RHOB|nr:manganese efflux pump MntP family protein [Paracoccus laeviglucosivorans]SMO75749.1 Putative Mn2+ efflux pump MntP [Paracoccus laeviglucosivorans]